MGRIVIGLLGAVLATVWWLGTRLDADTAPPVAHAAEQASRPHPNAVAARSEGAISTRRGRGHEPVRHVEPAGDRKVLVAAEQTHAIRGVVTRSGIGQAGREVVCVGVDGVRVHETVTDREGAFAFEVPPGRYRVRTLHAFGAVHRQPAFRRLPSRDVEPLAAAHATCEVEAEDVTLEMPLSASALVVTVRDAETLEPIPAAHVSWRPPAPAREELRFVTDAHGAVRIADVVAGSNMVHALARAFRAADQAVEVLSRGPDQVVDLLLQPACAVDVILVDRQRQPVAVSPALILALHPADRGDARRRDPVFPSNRKQFLSKQRPMRTPFDQIEAGTYELHFDEDRYEMLGEDLAVRFVPCVPLHEHVLEVRPGKLQRYEVPVESRCLARFRFVDEQDALLKGELQVRFRGADDVERAVLPAPWHHGTRGAGLHFEGYLKAGTYDLRFRRGDRTFRQSFVVETSTIDRTVRLPW